MNSVEGGRADGDLANNLFKQDSAATYQYRASTDEFVAVPNLSMTTNSIKVFNARRHPCCMFKEIQSAQFWISATRENLCSTVLALDLCHPFFISAV